MKRLLAAAVFLPSLAFASPLTLIATMQSQTGGTVVLWSGVKECYTGMGVIVTPPFGKTPLPGCVTDATVTGLHAYFSDGSERDYPYDAWDVVAKKGAL